MTYILNSMSFSMHQSKISSSVVFPWVSMLFLTVYAFPHSIFQWNNNNLFWISILQAKRYVNSNIYFKVDVLLTNRLSLFCGWIEETVRVSFSFFFLSLSLIHHPVPYSIQVNRLNPLIYHHHHHTCVLTGCLCEWFYWKFAGTLCLAGVCNEGMKKSWLFKGHVHFK